MLYAIEKTTGTKISPTKGLHALCPGCEGEVLAKCGDIYTHHWAHVNKECDYWSEPESEWHRGWKKLFPKEQCEVRYDRHIADAITTSGIVVEFQSSSISPFEIEDREKCYKKMIWILNAEKFDERFYIKNKGDYQTFTWLHARKSWLIATHEIYIDFGDMMFLIKKMHTGTTTRGWGRLINKDLFIKTLTTS